MKIIFISLYLIGGYSDNFYNDLFCFPMPRVLYRMVVVNTKSPEYTGRISVSVNTLMSCLNKKNKYNHLQTEDMNKFIHLIAEVLNSEIECSFDQKKQDVIRIKNIKEVENVAINGEEKLLDAYFHKEEKYYSMKEGISKDKTGAIIYALYKKGIFIRLTEYNRFTIDPPEYNLCIK